MAAEKMNLNEEEKHELQVSAGTISDFAEEIQKALEAGEVNHLRTLAWQLHEDALTLWSDTTVILELAGRKEGGVVA